MTSLFTGFLPRALAAGLLAAAVGASVGRAQAPQMPAAPLAGGVPALAGGSYMDAHGNSIVMPASYSAPGAECYGGGGGYAGQDPGAAYVDFGGYGPDQCGPYYFDVAVDVVALTPEQMFKGVPPLASVTALGPTVMDVDSLNDQYDVGWQIAVRYDLGPLSVLEATYMGLYDIGFTQTLDSLTETARFFPNDPPQQDQLNSVFSGYGADPILGLDEANTYTLDYNSDLQSTELSYRRYWLGYSPRVSGTVLLGFRYLRMTEDFNFTAVTNVGNGQPSGSQLFWGTANDLVGFQLGGDGCYCLLQGLRISAEAKAGVYNNRFKANHFTVIPDPSVANVDAAIDGNQVAFATDAKVELVCDILPSWSLRGGYRVLYMNNLATVGQQINAADISSAALFSQADALYHGFHAGLEYIW
jgi:hypothetical protein